MSLREYHPAKEERRKRKRKMKTNGNFTTAACATEIEVIKMGLLKE